MLKKIILPLSLFVLLAGCSTLHKLEPYKLDIQQGSVVTQEMIYKLKPGMTRSQVRFIMGSPSVADPFHSNRWDYIYRLSKGGKLVEERKIALFFENDLLKSVQGDVAPATPEDIAKAGEEKRAAILKQEEPAKGTAAGKEEEKPDAKADSKEDEPEEKGFFGRMLEKIGL
jgi:outer membrane protein assembly factor BamE